MPRPTSLNTPDFLFLGGRSLHLALLSIPVRNARRRTGAAGGRQLDAERARVYFHQAHAVQRDDLLVRGGGRRLGMALQQPREAAPLDRRRLRRAARARHNYSAHRQVKVAPGGAAPRPRSGACRARALNRLRATQRKDTCDLYTPSVLPSLQATGHRAEKQQPPCTYFFMTPSKVEAPFL
jgi:hypothetical protein